MRGWGWERRGRNAISGVGVGRWREGKGRG